MLWAGELSQPSLPLNALTCPGLRETSLLRRLAAVRCRLGAGGLVVRSVCGSRLEPLHVGDERGPLLGRLGRGCRRLGRDLLLLGQRRLQLLLRCIS